MYAIFASVKKNDNISSIKLKKVLSSSSQYFAFDSLQSKMEADTAYTITINKKQITKKTLQLVLEHSLSGLYYIKKINPQDKVFELVVPSMLIKDYREYMSAFKKEFKNIKKEYLFFSRSISKNIHDLLKEKKLTASSLINLITTNVLNISKLPSNFDMEDLKALNIELDNKGKKNKCVLGSDNFFSIKPNPCKSYFKFEPRKLSKKGMKKNIKKKNEIKFDTKFFEKSKELKKKERKEQRKKQRQEREQSRSKSSSSRSSRSSTSGISTGVGSISNVMGKKPEIKTKPPTISKTEMKMRLKNDEVKMKKMKKNQEMNKLLKKGTQEYESFTVKNKNKSKLYNFLQALVILFITMTLLGKTNNFLFKSFNKILSFPVNITKKIV